MPKVAFSSVIEVDRPLVAHQVRTDYRRKCGFDTGAVPDEFLRGNEWTELVLTLNPLSVNDYFGRIHRERTGERLSPGEPMEVSYEGLMELRAAARRIVDAERRGVRAAMREANRSLPMGLAANALALDIDYEWSDYIAEVRRYLSHLDSLALTEEGGRARYRYHWTMW